MDCWKLVHLHSIKFSIYSFENTAKFVETLFGKPIAHKSAILPLEFVHGSATMCILPLQIPIPYSTQLKFKSPTLWKAFCANPPLPEYGKWSNFQSICRGWGGGCRRCEFIDQRISTKKFHNYNDRQICLSTLLLLCCMDSFTNMLKKCI